MKGHEYVMAGLSNATINIFCILLLTILFLNVFRRNGKYLPDQKLFFYMMVSVAVLLVLDTIQWVCDGVPGDLSQSVNRISCVFYYMVQPIPCVCWCLYIRYQVTMDVGEMNQERAMLLVPFILNAIMSVLSYFFEYYFYIDNNNYYHRGEYFWLFVVFAYCYFAYAVWYVLINRAKIDRKVFISLVVFLLAPVIGSVLQILHYGLSLTWPGCSLSLVIIYINIQKDQLYTDHLTGLYNRRLLDIHLNSSLKKSRESVRIGVIMMDIDDFKSINDAFGHVVGDNALIELALVLKKSVGKEGFIARYGGDEFVAVISAKDSNDIKQVTDAIERNLKLFNERGSAPYKIEISTGQEIFECGGNISKHDVLNIIDKKMYNNKQGNRRTTQRSD